MSYFSEDQRGGHTDPPPLHEQERQRVTEKFWGARQRALIEAEERGSLSERARVLALIDRELAHVRLSDGQLGDVLRALRKDVEEAVEAPQVHPDASLVDRIDQHGHEDRAAADGSVARSVEVAAGRRSPVL